MYTLNHVLINLWLLEEKLGKLCCLTENIYRSGSWNETKDGRFLSVCKL